MSTVAPTHELYRTEHSPMRQIVLRVMGEGLYWLVILQLVTGLYLQTQMAAFGGRIVVSNGVPKLLLAVGIVLASAVAVLLARGRIALRPCMLPACVFLCYLAADLSWLVVTSRVSINALLFGFNKYFLFFAVIPAAALLAPQLTERQMNFRFMLLLIPLAAFALVQFGLNDSLLYLSDEDGLNEIPAADFYGQVRAFSLFRGVLECGQGMAFFGALLVAQLCVAPRQHPLWKVLLLGLSAAACYVTFRRGAYLEFGASAFSAFAIALHWKVARWLPWLYFAAAISLAGLGTVLGSVTGEGVLSAETLNERHSAWNVVLDRWLLREDVSLLFGTGLAQMEHDEIETFVVDNSFLAVGVQLGLVGLALWFWLMQSLWRDMLETAWNTRSTLAIAVAGLLSTWMMRGVFDPLFALYPLYVFLVFWTRPEPAPKPPAKNATRRVPACA